MNTKPAPKEYQIFFLDPNTKMSHIEGEPLFQTDCLAEACGYVYDAFIKEGREMCVYQPRSKGYCEYYRKSNKHSKRSASGQFTK